VPAAGGRKEGNAVAGRFRPPSAREGSDPRTQQIKARDDATAETACVAVAGRREERKRMNAQSLAPRVDGVPPGRGLEPDQRIGFIPCGILQESFEGRQFPAYLYKPENRSSLVQWFIGRE